MKRRWWYFVAMTLVNPLIGLFGPDGCPLWLARLRWSCFTRVWLHSDDPSRTLEWLRQAGDDQCPSF